jgi:predicted phosphodiesterase
VRIAILSDVHGNVRALEAVLSDVRARGPFDHVLNGGDLAAGGPRPAEAVALLRAEGLPAVVGNTDQWVAGLTSPPETMAEVAVWTRGRLTGDGLAYLRTLPVARRIEPTGGPPLVLVHATPSSTTRTVDHDAAADVLEGMLREAGTRTLAYGHIHWPYVREVPSGLVVNVGSVGLPADGVPRPAWAILTLADGRWSAEIVRTAYDTEAVARDLLAGDHPAGALFAERIRAGRLG